MNTLSVINTLRVKQGFALHTVAVEDAAFLAVPKLHETEIFVQLMAVVDVVTKLDAQRSL